MLSSPRWFALVPLLIACGPEAMMTIAEEDSLESLSAELDSNGMLAFLNGPLATVDALDNDVGLDARAAKGIVEHVRGPDGVLGSADDDRLGSILELDAIPYVGAIAMNAINRYVGSSSSSPNGAIRVIRAATVEKVPSGRPAPGTFRVHLIDVGTGLAILVQGADFNLLFDGGSTDDSAGLTATGNKSRLLAYLYAAIGPAADPACRPEGDRWPAAPGVSPLINHVFLSHPHQDHSNMLDDVLRCYRVQDVWDSGAVNETASYAAFLSAVASQPGVRYHTAIAPPSTRKVSVWGQTISLQSAEWTTFREGDRRSLGLGASFKVLFADGTYYPNQFNDNSTVLRLELGSTSVLLAADAEAGIRDTPFAPVGETEGALLERHRAELDVDILQVGHHGSRTSSRRAFLDAVSPRYALVSAGPTLNNGGVSFPDPDVIGSLTTVGAQVLRTDQHDNGCPEADRIGVDDTRPGGCDNYVLEFR